MTLTAHPGTSIETHPSGPSLHNDRKFSDGTPAHKLHHVNLITSKSNQQQAEGTDDMGTVRLDEVT